MAQLTEHASRELWARHGIPVPKGRLVSDPASAAALAFSSDVAVKAQVLAGGGGKVGGVVDETLEQACLGVVNLGQSAEMQFLASLAGTPRELSAESVTVRTRVNRTPAFVAAAAWGYYTELAAQR